MQSDGAIVKELPELVTNAVVAVSKDALLVGLTTLGVTYAVFRAGKYIYVRRKVGRLRKENEAALAASIQRIEKSLESKDVTLLQEVVALPWDQLLSKLKNGSLTASTVLSAYQRAAVATQQKTNAVTIFFQDAEAKAAELDAVPEKERGPLHGIPVSIKECYDVAGTYSTAGCAYLARTQVTSDCPAVELLRKLGALPFCKTNVPQVMYSLQCSNPLYGTTENPYKRGREAGGSSGGEGALVGGGGSVLGLGSDIGGSLRNPPAFCGAFSLKPTVGRHLSQLGVAPYAGHLGIDVTGGFITGSALALESAWRAVWDDPCPQAADPTLVPLMWDEESYQAKPTIGFYTWDGLLQPASGCQRAVTEAVALLEQKGYKVVPIQSPDIRKVVRLFSGTVLSDLNKQVYKDLSYDLYDSTLNGVVAAVTFYKLPWLLKKLILNPLLSLFTRVPSVEEVYDTATSLTEAMNQRNLFVKDYLGELNAAGVDAFLCPAMLLPAPPCGVLGTFFPAVIPYVPWNLLNFPAGIAPITKWSKEDAEAMANYPKDDIAYRMVNSYCKDAEGLPLAVQVVGRPFKDEQVLRLLRELETKPEL